MTATARILLAAALALGAWTTSIPALAQKPFQPYGEGLPLPWPFPWARGCRVAWESLEDAYEMFDRGDAKETFNIYLTSENNRPVLHITRYDFQGMVANEGSVPVFERASRESKRSVTAYLRPTSQLSNAMWVTIKMHYSSYRWSCEPSNLTPILSIVEKKTNTATSTQYRLVRKPNER